MKMLLARCFVLSLFLSGSTLLSTAQPSANRLAYLDEFCDPYYPDRSFPKLTTPQWIGEPGVDAAVVLAIDDMSQYAAYEVYLRPILERLKQIDGRAALSIMANTIQLSEPQLQVWLKEGVSIETHTSTHPCPILADGDFEKARQSYDRCIDHFFQLSNNIPVAFRTPCMDGMNSTSPRLYSELMMKTTPAGHFISFSSSVAHFFTASDAELPSQALLDNEGKERFRKYQAKGFVNQVENYPYPYLVGGSIWELPFSVPDDYQGFQLHGGKNPKSLQDMETALDLTVLKKGIYTQCFHPYPWIANTQMVAWIDHAVAKHGKKVKFLNFREVSERMSRHLLAGQSVRATNGDWNGIRLLDLNGDGYLDVVIGNEQLQRTRLWDPATQGWKESGFPVRLVEVMPDGHRRPTGVRFGTRDQGRTVFLMVNSESASGCWRFESGGWVEEPDALRGWSLEGDGGLVKTQLQGKDRGVRFRDLDGDGEVECLVSNPDQNGVLEWSVTERTWKKRAYGLPEGVALVDREGRDHGLRFVDLNGDHFEDVVFSNAERYSIHLLVPSPVLGFKAGWSREVLSGARGTMPEIPPIVRAGAGGNNGAWFAGREMRVQNEDTSKLPDLIQRISYDELLSGFQSAALSPQEALKTFTIDPGFRIELAASEPQVQDPVYMDWDARGRLWVVAMRDYPLGMDGHGKPGGDVRLLEDRDHDGFYEHSTVFLSGLNFPNGLLPWKNGVLISAAPHLLYAEDTDGDGKADRVEKLFSGFGEGNQQHRANGFEYGLDNWVYGANGDSGGAIRPREGGGATRIDGHDFRFRPDEGLFQAVAGHTQFGRRRDDWGNWFGNANYMLLWHYWIPENYLRRNPRLVVDSIHRETAISPDAGRVFPVGRKQQRMNDVGMAGHVTSANSPTIYRDELFGPEFAHAVFISEPVHNLVRCELLERKAVAFTSHKLHPEERAEFLASTDSWFRPTGSKVGPDGALYIADMYRQYIEHPEWIPNDIKSRVNLRAGEDKGRIYRVVPVGARPRVIPDLAALDPKGMVEALDHPSGWQRDMVQRSLVQQRDTNLAPAIRAVLQKTTRATTRVTALATLDGLGTLTQADVVAGLQDAEAGVREEALRLAERFLASPESSLVAALEKATTDPVTSVRYQAALTLGEWPNPRAANLLANIALQDAGISEIRVAVASSAFAWPEEIFTALVASGRDLADLEPLLVNLVDVLSGKNRPGTLRRLLDLVGKSTDRIGARAAWQIGVAGHLFQILEKSTMDAATSASLATSLAPLAAESRRWVMDPAASLPKRRAAVSLLGRDASTLPEDLSTLLQLLLAHQPEALQDAALHRLNQMGGEGVPVGILDRFTQLSPRMRTQSLELLLRREAWTSKILDRLEQSAIKPSDLSASLRQRLLTLSSAALKTRAEALLQTSSRPERQHLIEEYLPAVAAAKPDLTKGSQLFAQQCSACHRLGNQGKGVAPDLLGLPDRSPERMLTAILDPNRAVEDRYRVYTARTRRGEDYHGMVTSETGAAVTLVSAGGISETLLRSDLESLSTTGLSLMPEGFEQILKPQDVADLLAYLDSVAVPPKVFPGNHPSIVTLDSNRAARLLASVCEIHGDGLVFETPYRNLGSWNGISSRAVWTVELPADGVYEVWMQWACPAESAGNRLRLQVGDQIITHKVGATASWDEYLVAKLGEVKLSPGRHRVVMQPAEGLKGWLLDLAEIRLVPAGQAGVPAFVPPGRVAGAR